MLFFKIPLCEHSFWCMGVTTYDIVLSFPVYLSFNRIQFELFFGFLVLFWRKVHTSKSDVVRLPESITVKPTPHFVFPHFKNSLNQPIVMWGAHACNCQTLGGNKFLSGNVTCSVEFLLFMRDLEMNAAIWQFQLQKHFSFQPLLMLNFQILVHKDVSSQLLI